MSALKLLGITEAEVNEVRAMAAEAVRRRVELVGPDKVSVDYFMARLRSTRRRVRIALLLGLLTRGNTYRRTS